MVDHLKDRPAILSKRYRPIGYPTIAERLEKAVNRIAGYILISAMFLLAVPFILYEIMLGERRDYGR